MALKVASDKYKEILSNHFGRRTEAVSNEELYAFF